MFREAPGPASRFDQQLNFLTRVPGGNVIDVTEAAPAPTPEQAPIQPDQSTTHELGGSALKLAREMPALAAVGESTPTVSDTVQESTGVTETAAKESGVSEARSAVDDAITHNSPRITKNARKELQEGISRASNEYLDSNMQSLSDTLNKVRSGELTVVQDDRDAVEGQSISARRLAKTIEAREVVEDQLSRRSQQLDGAPGLSERARKRTIKKNIRQFKREFEGINAGDRANENPSEVNFLSESKLTGKIGTDAKIALKHAAQKTLRKIGVQNVLKDEAPKRLDHLDSELPQADYDTLIDINNFQMDREQDRIAKLEARAEKGALSPSDQEMLDASYSNVKIIEAQRREIWQRQKRGMANAASAATRDPRLIPAPTDKSLSYDRPTPANQLAAPRTEDFLSFDGSDPDSPLNRLRQGAMYTGQEIDRYGRAVKRRYDRRVAPLKRSAQRVRTTARATGAAAKRAQGYVQYRGRTR